VRAGSGPPAGVLPAALLAAAVCKDTSDGASDAELPPSSDAPDSVVNVAGDCSSDENPLLLPPPPP
jgi:hypothetical protein